MRTLSVYFQQARENGRYRWAGTVLLGLVVAAMLAACGGGGGGGGSSPTSYTISGTITSAVNGAAVANTTITLAGPASATTATDGAGQYHFSGLGNGNYSVAAALPSSAFSPASRWVTINGASMANQDFLAVRAGTVAAGIKFLPDSFSSAEQLRASLLVRAGYAYFSDSSEFPIKRAALSGTDTAALATRFAGARKVVLHGQDVYWTDRSTLNRTPLNGGSTTVLAVGTSDHGDLVTADLVVDDAYAYWANTVSSPGCIIQRVPVTGGAPLTLATASRKVAALTSDADHLYWEEASLEPVWAGCQCGSSIKAIPKTGGVTALLVDGLLNGALPPPPPGHVAGSWYPTGGLATTTTELLFGVASGPSYQVLAVPMAGGSTRTVATVNSSAGLAGNAIQGLSVSGGNAYWLDRANQTLASVPIAGGSVTALATGLGLPADLNLPVALAVDTTNAFWTEPAGPVGCCLRMGSGSIKRLPLAGGAISDVLSGLDAPAALAIDAAHLVWTEAWRVGKATLDGASITTLASGITSNLARLAADQTSLYVLDGDYIKKLPLTGGTVEVLASAQLGTLGDFSATNQDITTDGSNVYWTVKYGPGAPIVQKVPVAGGAPVTLAAEAAFVNPQDGRWRILVDAQNVYWSTSGTAGPISGAVKKVPILGGAVTTLVDYPYLVDFTVDGGNVYFSEFGTNPGSLRKVALSGGPVTAVLDSVAAWVLTNDAARLYWIDLQYRTLGELSKTAGTGTPASTFPGALTLNPLQAFEELVIVDGCLYVTETQTGSIYSIY